ncbi:MAG TPA: hypothetical protein VEO54_30240 [Thermoanaerobaculia bacterium]|nr:hypothetical protein [Thermoanaerobaculia bacterium]
MRGRVAILSFLLPLSSFLFSPSATAQCNWTPRLSVPFRTTALDVSIDGTFLWLATGYGVQLLQNDGTRVAGSIALPGATRVVLADGRGNAYAGSGSRLYVLRGSASGVQLVGGVDAGATVNDLLIAGGYLFAATANGLVHFDILEPANPIRTSAVLPTTSPNVTSLAATGTRLYAADGDTSLEVFSITIPSVPQRTGELATLRAASVHAAPDGTLYVSDALGLNSDIFPSGATTRLARLPAGTTAFAAGTNNVHFTAGAERTIRAVDFSSTTTVQERFELQLAPTAGTDNVIHAMARAGNKLYVAAGDMGLAILDIGPVAPPYPVVAYRSGATTSVVVSGDRAWFADGAKILEQSIDTNGIAMTAPRTLADSAGLLVHDVRGDKLLTSNGGMAMVRSLAATPATGPTTTFPGPIRTAALAADDTVVALLQDGTVWAGAQQLPLPRITFMGHHDGNIVFVERPGAATSVIHRYGSDVKHTVSGAALGGVAVDATRAAIFTFAGINVVDLATGAVTVIPESHRVVPQQLAFAGEHVLLLDRRTLYVFDRNGLVRQQPLPADAYMLDARPGVAVLATNEGTSAVSYLGQQPTPSILGGSTFYTKLAASSDRLYLSSGDTIDIFAGTTHFEKNLRVGGLFDFTATESALFALSAAGVVTAYSPQGVQYAQLALDEGSDAQMIGIETAGGAVWVSLSRGCLTGGCQKKTLVLDPASLAITSTMNGGTIDLAVAGTRAYALTDLPAEVRVLDIRDPLHPVQLVATAAPASATSLAAYSGRVYVAGDRLYEYAESTLLPRGTHLTAVANPDPAQQVRVDGNCLVLTARGANPEAYDAATLAPATTFELPSNARAAAVSPGRLVILTGHSIEVWSTAAPAPRKRRSS